MNHEPAHNPARPILAQRSWGFPTASMCKPLLIRTPVAWTGGFHNSTAPVAFDRLFLFHLAFFDCETTLRRQQKRRAQNSIDDRTAPHHRLNDETIRSWMEGWSGMPQDQSITLTASCPATADFIADVLKSASRDAHGMYHIDLDLHRSSLWRIPDRFSGSF